mgnify:CR=1 FL=1|jgi:hypothetical protein
MECDFVYCFSCLADNKMEIVSYGAEDHLRVLLKSSNDRISQQVIFYLMYSETINEINNEL